MSIPTEPIGSLPRSPELLAAMRAHAAGQLDDADLAILQDEAVRDTIERLEAVGSTVVTDGEQTKPSFISYPTHGAANLAPGGVVVPFADGHQRQFPRLTSGPFRYQVYAVTYLRTALRHANVPVKQTVVAPSALSLLYPDDGGVEGYPRDAFLADLASEAETDIRRCLEGGAHSVQLDFTEGRLSLKLDPSGQVLTDFVALNNEVLGRFSEQDRTRLGVHVCPGGDQDSTHSLDVDYAGLLPSLFQLRAGNYYLQLASEPDPEYVLKMVRDLMRPGIRIFVGVTDPILPRVETPQEVRDRVLQAAVFIPLDQLGTCDDCGFSPFADDLSTSRDTALAKIRARVEGTALAARALGG